VPHTIAEALDHAARRLAGGTAAGGSARAEAEELLGRLLELPRAALYLERGHVLPEAAWEKLVGWIERRRAGEPLQYITGRAAFRSLDLAVRPGVLIPRPETEGLVEAVLGVLRVERARWPRPRVLDLGTGSGAIALALAAEWPEAFVTATDASDTALAVARGNAAALGLEGRVRWLKGDWFDAVGGDDLFEVVVSNPPYIATTEAGALPRDVAAFEPPEALYAGESGLEALREIVDQAPRHLVGDGLLALELAEMRAHEVAGWLEGANDWAKASLLDDLAGRPRVLVARRARGPAIAPRQWPEER